MKRLLLLATIIAFGIHSFGQISHGGRPIQWEGKSTSSLQFERIEIPNLEELAREDAINDQYKNVPYRFGVENAVDFSTDNSGSWTVLEDGTRVWRMGISAPGAVSINFDFDVYQVPAGAKVFVYDPEQSQVAGSFTNENTSKKQSLGIGLLSSDKIIIEYIVPAEITNQGYLHINNVVYGYRSVLNGLDIEAKAGPFGNSGACNIDVNCADIELYDPQKRSVALIVDGGAICTGVLVNNTLQDEHPFFLTANHCLPFNENNTQDWVFYFNHEIPECGGSDDDAPVNQSVSGGSVLARNTKSDFALLELDNDIPSSYGVCFSGWDASDNEGTVTSAYGIHHPSGDVKKICFEEDSPYHDSEFFDGNPNTLMWWIDEWEEGVTEGGSSGSPLFNQSGMIIGQLAGGLAACNGPVNNGQFDYYGRFGVSWDFGSTPETRLRDWLDPIETGQLVLLNSCSVDPPENDLTLGTFETDQYLFCSLETIDESISVLNTGSNDISSFVLSFSINGEAQSNIEWSGTLGTFQNETIDLGQIQLVEGVNNVEIQIVSVNGGEDANETGNQQSNEYLATANPAYVDFTLQLDDYPMETSWRVIDADENILYSGGGYTEGQAGDLIQDEFCFPEGCYTFIIEDSWGDGICCGEGNGFYLLQDANGNTLAEGGDFEDDAVELFCAEPLSTNESEILKSISVYPNPAQNFVNIQLGDVQKAEQVLITDMLGRVLDNKSGNEIQGQVFRLETSSLPTGVYMIQIKTEIGNATRKVVLE